MQARLSIAADHIRFKQILLNLLTNGIKYNKMGGSITLETEDVGSQRIRITVTDTGIGIANEGGSGLFEPFNRLGHETGNIEGTGIGLTIAKQMVESMEGQIGFNSEVGKGSDFRELNEPSSMRPLQPRSRRLSATKASLYSSKRCSTSRTIPRTCD